ncbi:restriction endonuclease subunit S [Exiguobacterium mexicanum]|uniref:restriction endonuclease subunit S n=1 Tax=Exiguobacterium mexicanum TaxID=340146 RepID=UPI00384E8198
MRKYEAYVDSEIEWVGEMPSHWKKIRHKNVFNKAQDIVGEDSSKYDVLSLTIRGVIKRDIESNIGKMPASFDGYQIVKPNSLLLCLFDIDVTPRCIGYVNQDGITTSAYTNIKVKNNTFYAKYYYYWFLMLDMDKTLLHLSKNLRNSIGITEFMALTTIYPPVNEQKKISCYLDKKIKEIDDTVALMNIYIEKVLENRQSIITEAVTKGLNSNVKMKDSGVEWIGEIPEHWETKKVKYLIQEKLSYGANEAAELDDENSPRYIRITDIDELGNLKKETFKSLPLEIAKNYVVKTGDILLARSGGTVGKSYIHKEDKEASYAGYLIKLRAQTLTLAEYIYYFTNSSLYEQWINSILIQATIQNVSAEKYANLTIPIPNNENEMKNIVSHIKIKERELLTAVDSLKEQIKKLKEYRQSLIYEAVTGKIDVREMEID